MDFAERLGIMIEEINKVSAVIEKAEIKSYEFVTDMQKAESKRERFEAMQKSRLDAINIWRATIQQIEQTAPESANMLDGKLNLLEKTIKRLNETYPKRSFFNSKEKERYRRNLEKYLKGYDEVYLAIKVAQKTMIETLNKIIEDYNKYGK